MVSWKNQYNFNIATILTMLFFLKSGCGYGNANAHKQLYEFICLFDSCENVFLVNFLITSCHAHDDILVQAFDICGHNAHDKVFSGFHNCMLGM